MTYDELKTMVKNLYPVNEIEKGFSYWRKALTEKCVNIFEYENLPDSLPAVELETRLINTGFTGVFKHPKKGLVAAYGGLSGQDEYYKPKMFTYAQPVLGSNVLKIHEECVIIFNSFSDTFSRQGLSELIMRYARLLADIDSSINIMTVNTRAVSVGVAKTQQAAKSANAVFKMLEIGKREVIVEDTLLDVFKTVPFANYTNSPISDLITARNSILKSFFQEIGIRMSTEKRERLISDEIYADNQILLINLDDMLKYRKKGVDEINKLFGTDIQVKVSKYFNLGVEQNDNRTVLDKQ